MATKRRGNGECCELMNMVLARTAAASKPQSLAREIMFDFTGKRRPADYTAIVIHLPRAKKDDKSPHAKAAYAVVNYCPFCGAKVAEEKNGKKPAAAAVSTA